MSDIASLGFEIDSKPLADTNKELAKMPTEAAKAERSAKTLTDSVNKLGKSSTAAAAAAARVANDNGTVAKALGATDAAFKVATSNAQNLSKAYLALSASAAKAANSNVSAARRASQYSRAPSAGWGPPPVSMGGATGGGAGAGGAGGAASALATAATAAAIAKVATESEKAEKSVLGFKSALALALTTAVAFGGSLVSMFGLAKFVGQTEIVSDSLGELGKTWSQLFIVGKQAAVPLAIAIDDLAAALDNPVFRGFVHTIGQLLFGAMQLAVEGVTMLVNAVTFLVENVDTLQVAFATAGTLLLVAFGPTIFAGIVSGFVALGAAGVSAVTAITAAIAANPLGALAVGITAAVTALYIFRDEVAQAIGIDVIGVVKGAANYIIGSFVAAYGDIKFLWASFPDIIGAAVIGAVNAVARGIQSILQVSARGIDWLIEQANKIPGLSIGKIGDLSPVQEQANPYADRLAKGMQNRGKQQQDELNRDYLGQLGNALQFAGQGPRRYEDTKPDGKGGGAAEKAYDKIIQGAQQYIEKKQVETQVLGMNAQEAARLRHEQELFAKAQSEGIKLTAAQTLQLQGLAAAMADADAKFAASKFMTDTEKSSAQFVANQQLQAQTIGMSAEAAARLRYETELLNKAANDNIALTPAQTARISELAGAMASAEARTNKLKDAYDLAKTTVTGFLSDVRSNLHQGQNLWDSFGNAGLNALSKITDKLTQMVVDDLFSKAFGGGSGGGGGGGIGGFLSSALSWISGLFANGAAFSRGHVTAFARGGVVNRPTLFPMATGAGLMGEAGPEAVMPLQRGPNGRLGVANFGGAQQQGGRVEIYIYDATELLNVKIDNRADARIVKASPTIIKKATDESREQVVPTVNRYKADRQGDWRAA